MLIKMLFLSSRRCKHHSCSSRRDETVKLGHGDDVVNQEHRCSGCSYCYRYAVAFILTRLWLLSQKHDHDLYIADVVKLSCKPSSFKGTVFQR